ncbi:hypothetical protein PITC_021720 [Penicillium italicum]|uniref:Uncharacterized protein n=1 Tax=Penicillium italicum TaxID=40296 RepID=A0A0A2LBK8_PENIT|nr:hypothetical protein PITC_021720 [Penicillium italicum]
MASTNISLTTTAFPWQTGPRMKTPGHSGQIVHPQLWPKDLQYKDKKTVIIGSGATAITLLPNLADHDARVTMLQRSPTYILSVPNRSISRWLSYILPNALYHTLPKFRALAAHIKCPPAIASHIPYDPHFKPKYNPWEQRLYVYPEGNLFRSLRRLQAARRYLPNAALIIGYTNASLSLGSDATAQLVCRLLKELESRKLIADIPRLKEQDAATLQDRPLLNLKSTYVSLAERVLPKAADRGPWQPRDHYFKDLKFAQRGDIDTGLEFVQGPNLRLHTKMS